MTCLKVFGFDLYFEIYTGKCLWYSRVDIWCTLYVCKFPKRTYTGSHVSLVDTIADCWHVHSSSPMETWATTPHKPYKILGLHGHGVYRRLEKKDWIKINPIISRALVLAVLFFLATRISLAVYSSIMVSFLLAIPLQRIREFQWVFQTCPVWGLIFFCDQLWLIFDKTLDRSGMIQTWRILYNCMRA